MGAPGCDDAPVVEVQGGRNNKRVTFIYPYYENPKFFLHQQSVWASYDRKLSQYLSIIVVDDGSTRVPARENLWKIVGPKQQLFEIDVDVRWNWLAARNIGAHHAADEWLLLTDMDHVITENVLAKLITGDHDPFTIYRFSRREHDGTPVHPHPNSWFMTKRMYWRTGGYDEALSGFYGTDGDYRRRCVKTAPIRILTDELVRHEYVGDSSTTHYKRKQPEDAGKKAIISTRQPGWRPKVLSFPYHEVNL